MTVRILGEQRRGRAAVDTQVPGPVVFDDECPPVAGGEPEHLFATRGTQHGTGRIGIAGLEIDHRSACAFESVGEFVGSDAVGVRGHSDELETGRLRGDHRARIAGALGYQRRTGFGKRAQCVDERLLATGHDQHVARIGVELLGEDSAQIR